MSKYFDRIERDRLIEFLQRRIGDRRLLRLVGKWLRAQGYVTAAEMAQRLGKSVWTVAERARQGHILREDIRTGKRLAAMYKLPPGGTAPQPEKTMS